VPARGHFQLQRPDRRRPRTAVSSAPSRRRTAAATPRPREVRFVRLRMGDQRLQRQDRRLRRAERPVAARAAGPIHFTASRTLGAERHRIRLQATPARPSAVVSICSDWAARTRDARLRRVQIAVLSACSPPSSEQRPSASPVRPTVWPRGQRHQRQEIGGSSEGLRHRRQRRPVPSVRSTSASASPQRPGGRKRSSRGRGAAAETCSQRPRNCAS